jgi:protein gp37
VNKTKIEWCDFTWNPVVGCTGDCTYCYARKMAHRFHRDFTPHWVQKNFERPMPKKPSRIFVNSMSDIAEWIGDWTWSVEARIKENPQHLFLSLSKRPWDAWMAQSDNSWIGYSVTVQEDFQRLMRNHAPVSFSFLSIEPILGPINLGRRDRPWRTPSWIIVGAETGNRKGKVVPNPKWLLDIFSYAGNNGIPLFFKESLRSIWPSGESDYFPQEFPA